MKYSGVAQAYIQFKIDVVAMMDVGQYQVLKNN